MATTRWIDTETTDFDSVLTKIISSKPDKDRYTDIQAEVLFENNLTENFGGRDIVFNYISYQFTYAIPGEQPIEDRSNRYQGFVIPYFNGTNINYIINRNSDAKKLLRLFLGYTGQNEIVDNKVNITSDFFVWLISKVFKTENSLIIDEEDMPITVDAIKGFKGDSADELTKVSADGRSVMNIISTLSFLLESNSLNQIKLDIEYLGHENIELILSTKNTISTVLDKYDGDYDDFEREKHTAYLYLLIYLEMIPKMIQIYQLELDNNDWGTDKYKEFLNSVANKLQQNVAAKIQELI